MLNQAKVEDWQVLPIAQTGAAAGYGGGVYWFWFKSPSIGVKEAFAFMGGGTGAGGSCGGVSLTQKSFVPIECEEPFSLFDLNGAVGKLESEKASFVVGHQAVEISASSNGAKLFDEQDVGGWCAGVALNEMELLGTWRSLTLSKRELKGVFEKLHDEIKRLAAPIKGGGKAIKDLLDGLLGKK